MRKRVIGALLAGSILLSGAAVACDESDRPEAEDVERGVEKGGREVEQQVEEGGEETGEGQ